MQMRQRFAAFAANAAELAQSFLWLTCIMWRLAYEAEAIDGAVVSIGDCVMATGQGSFNFSDLLTYKESYLVLGLLLSTGLFSVSSLGTSSHGSFCIRFVLSATVKQRRVPVSSFNFSPFSFFSILISQGASAKARSSKVLKKGGRSAMGRSKPRDRARHRRSVLL